MCSRAAISLCVLVVGAHEVHAQRTEERNIARTFELRAREGFDRQLDEGYRRHLDWHAGAGEPWGWYLWEITNGARAGLYVDGTFGHAWADFDTSVDPPGDSNDNELNVEPFAVRAANQLWRIRPELGGNAVDPESAALVMRTEYSVSSRADSSFVVALGRLRAAVGTRPYSVFELLNGGELRTYVVWIPVASWAQVGAFTDQTADITRALSESAERSRAELWRFRRDLSLCRSASARCHGTLAFAKPPAQGKH
ncbi:MAG: hypothetical protein ABJE10_08650 [bacterium]